MNFDARMRAARNERRGQRRGDGNGGNGGSSAEGPGRLSEVTTSGCEVEQNEGVGGRLVSMIRTVGSTDPHELSESAEYEVPMRSSVIASSANELASDSSARMIRKL